MRHRLTRWWWPLALLALPAALAILVAPASAQTLSSDATLRNLTLSEGRLSPAFDSATTTYMAAVGYTVPRVTVSPVTNDASATVAYTDGAEQPLTDADSAAGQQVDLAVGENVIKVKVTAEDGNATETYTITVTRTEEDTSLSPASSDAAAAFPSAAVYLVTFTGEWNTAVTPDGVPGDAHFSIPIGAVHNSSVTFLRSQGMASAGIESMAELGTTRRLELEIAAAGENALSLLRGMAISSTGSTTLTATLTTEHPRVTLTAMIGPSHDWFVGVSGMILRDGSSRWLRALGVDLFPWDAGTEEGTDFAFSPDVATSPQGTIESIRGTGKFTTKRIASLSFTLQSVRTTRSVAENTAAGADIGEPVVSSGASGAVTYTLGGTDAASFDIVASTGQLQTKAALDHENKSSYKVTVTATDSGGAVATTVTIEVTNIYELLLTLSGPASVSAYPENDAIRVASYTASSPEDRDDIKWSVSGADRAQFSIEDGALRFHIDSVNPDLFLLAPDFESPVDSDMDNVYEVTVKATADSTGQSLSKSVSVTVINQEEAGTVTLSPAHPSVGTVLTAALSDPDGVVAGTATWTWERLVGPREWVPIAGASSASYTPVAADGDNYLRAAVSYTDGHGAARSAQGRAGNVVLAHQLSQLQVTTTAIRQMYPSFDPAVLHYAVGCEDTLTLLLSTRDTATRLAVNGTQYPNQSASVELTGLNAESDITVRLSGATGASTTYVVHCTSDSFPNVEVNKSQGAWEGLITASFRGTSPEPSYIALFDNNGVPRLHKPLPYRVSRFQYHPKGKYPFSFFRPAGGSREAAILDWDLNIVDTATTVAPLTDTDGHDFVIRENGHYVFIAHQPITREVTILGQYRTIGMEDSTIQEVTPAGAQVFLWNSFDHMALEDCMQHRWPGDWGHMNSLQLLDDGDIVASLRGCSQVVRIDRDTGNVVWRMGRSRLSSASWAQYWDDGRGKAPLALVADPESEFCGQHSASLLANGRVLMFDNGNHCLREVSQRYGGESSKYGEFSRAAEYALDIDSGEAIFVRDYSSRGARNELTISSGRVTPMDNGDWLISWGRSLRAEELAENPRPGTVSPYHAITQVDPASRDELLTMRFTRPADSVRYSVHAFAVDYDRLVEEPARLTAVLPASSYTSGFHSGATDSPQVVVAFTRPVVDFDETSPSLSVTGGTIGSVRAHLVAGEPANAYLITLTPAGKGPVTFRLVADQPCASGGICTADAKRLSDVPGALVIGPPVTVSFGQVAYSVREGATISVPVRLSAAYRGVRGISVPVIVSAGSTASTDDYSVTGKVTFGAGQAQQTVSLKASDDALVEGPEIVILAFGPLPTGVTEGNVATTDITINDADTADIRFTAPVSEVAEGGEVSLNVTIANGVTFAADQTITLAIGGTVDTSDFYLRDNHGLTLAAPYAITLPARASSAQARLGAVDDTQIESASETVTITATLAGTNRSLGVQTIAIPASDVPDTPTVTISPGASVTEGADATFTLFRTDAPNHPLTSALTVRLRVTATGSTLSGATPSTATFDAGSTTATVQVTTLDDRVVEPPGTVTALVLGSRSNPPVYLTGVTNVATVTVSDNDVAAFTLEASAEEVAEGGAVTVTITVDNVTFAEPQAITLTLGGTATHGDDFILAGPDGALSDPYTVTLPAGTTSVRITVRTARDDEDDVGETVELSASHEGNPIGTVAVTITTPLPSIPFIPGGGGGGPSGPSPSKLDFEWTVTRDIDELDGDHGTPTGLWSDGTTLWIAENGAGADDAIYAYDLKTGERVEEREFELDEANRAPRGIWSDRTVMWVSDSGRNRLFAHDLEGGERLPDSDIALAERNGDTRGIWSDGETMWVLDGGKDSLFAYDVASDDLLAEYALDSANSDPHGIWSDRVTVWVSDHGAKRLFAYRLPARPETPAEDGAERQDLKRVGDEEFKELSKASNNSPRGIWSDGDFMYVVDESDDKVYTYNMPDAIDARLASLTFSGVDIGEFDRNRTEYAGTPGESVTQTTVEAVSMQRRTKVVIDPPDADGEENGYQVALAGTGAITVTVTSADGSRTRVYRVAFVPPVMELVLSPTWTSFEWPGGDGTAVVDALREGGISDRVLVVYKWDEAAQSWRGFFPDLEDVPGLKTLTTLAQGKSYWIATTEPVTWTVVKRGAALAAADRGP